MSALAVLCRDDGIVVACDTIAFDSATGVIMSINAGKVLMVPEVNTIIGNTGAGNFTSFLRAVMGFKYSSFDEAIEGSAIDFATTLTGMIDIGQAAPDTPCTAFYAGWSDARGQFEAYRISAKDKEVNTAGVITIIPAGTLSQLQGDWCSRAFSAEDAARFGTDRGFDVSSLELATGYICAARASCPTSSAEAKDGIDETFAVGGDLHLFMMERAKMTTWVTHRWPDKVGEMLDNSSGDAMPEWLAKAVAAAGE